MENSNLLGTLPTFSDNEHNIWFYTLVTLFYQIEQEKKDSKESSLKISAWEVFMDQIIDLVKGEYKENKAECSFVTVDSIGQAVDTLKAIYSIRSQYIDQLENESFDSTCSQSHLVVELSISSEKGSGIVSLIDSVGFDTVVNPRILGASHSTPCENSSEPELSTNQNDYFMYSLKNLIHDTWINLIGLVNSNIGSFLETLNTLDFWEDFGYANFNWDESSMIVDENWETVVVPHISLNGILNQQYEPRNRIETFSDSVKFEQIENLNGLHPQNICKEVQISYLDNRLDPCGMPGDLEEANATASIPDYSEQYSVISGESK